MGGTHRSQTIPLLAVLLLGACSSPAALGSSPSVPVASDQPEMSVVSDPTPRSTLMAMTPSQRQWLVELQTTLRWARDLADVLYGWWRTDELGRLHRGLLAAEEAVVDVTARHGVPRLAAAWSPVDDVDDPLARRYDRMMRRALLSAEAALSEVAAATAAVVNLLDRVDVAESDLDTLVATLTARLDPSQSLTDESPNTTKPS